MTFFSEDTDRNRSVQAETYVGQFRRPGVRIALRSGPRGGITIINLYEVEFARLVQAYLRMKAANGELVV